MSGYFLRCPLIVKIDTIQAAGLAVEVQRHLYVLDWQGKVENRKKYSSNLAHQILALSKGFNVETLCVYFLSFERAKTSFETIS